MDLSNWGPVGTPDEITRWFREFADGREPLHLSLRVPDQFGQVRRFG